MLLDEDFRGSTVSTDFRIGGRFTPCLTASLDADQRPFPGCALTAADPEGEGALRLTDNGDHLTGFAILNTALPFTAGAVVEFETFAYNGTRFPGYGGADGISVFLRDAAVEADAPGAFGGSLGYAQSNDDFEASFDDPPTIPGVPGGYVGVGIDEFGNFSNDRETRGFGCDERADRDLHPERVSLRGAGVPGSEWTRGYCFLAGSARIVGLDDVDSRTRPAPHRWRVQFDPPAEANARVRLFAIDDLGVAELVLDEPQPGDPDDRPRTFEIGFASSTGDGTNIHEIRAVRITSFEPLPIYALDKTHDGDLLAGGRGEFRLRAALSPNGGQARAPVTLRDELPDGVQVAARPRGTGWDCSTTLVGSQRVRCTYAIAARQPVAAGTALPEVIVPVRIAPDVDGQLVNVATLDGPEILTPPRDEDPFTVRRAADLAVRKLARPVRVAPGGRVAFGLVVTNAGPSDARGVVLVDTLPAGLEAVEATASDGRCTTARTRVRCELGTIRAGGSKQVLVTARSTGTPGRLRDVGEVTSREPDPNPADNRDEATVEVTRDAEARPAPSLVVRKRASARQVRVGEPLRYTERVTNEGGATARDVVLVDTNSLPIRVLSLRSSRGTCDRLRSVVICRLGDLPPGGLATVRLRVAILRAERSVNAAGVLAPDQRLARASVRVRGGAALRLRKTASRTAAPLGAVVGFRITVRSLGPEPAERVRVCDRLPRQLTLVGRRGRTVCWRLSGLEAGRSRTFRIRARVTAAGPRARNRATAVAANASRVRARRTIGVRMPPGGPEFTG